MDRSARDPFAGGPPPGAVWIDASGDKVATWSLVLDAEGIAYRVIRRPDGGWSVMVATADAERSLRALSAYEQENPPQPPSAVQPADRGGRYGGIAMAVLLAVFFVVAPPILMPGSAFDRGAAVAGLIRDGQLWRVVTALTLHADLAHLLSNMVGAALFATALCQILGFGVAAMVMLLAGAGGNWLNALIEPAGHVSVGASTAIFGAVGALVGVQLVRRRRLRASWLTVWSPVLAGLVLLALMGTAPQADVAAHVLGFLVGGALGAAVARLDLQAGDERHQWTLAIGALIVIAGCWALALH
jgi:rhomboid protease GluP